MNDNKDTIKDADLDLIFLNETSQEFSRCIDERDVYKVICNRLKKLVEYGIVSIAALDEEDNSLKVIEISEFGKFLNIVYKTFGIDPFKLTFKLDEMNDEERKLLLSEKLEKIDGGIYALLVRKISEKICLSVEKIFDIKDVYRINFVWNQKHYGSASIIVPEGTIIKKAEMIETIINQAEDVLQKIKLEKKQ